MCALGRRPVVRLLAGCHKRPPPPVHQVSCSGHTLQLLPKAPQPSPPLMAAYIVTEMTGLRNRGAGEAWCAGPPPSYPFPKLAMSWVAIPGLPALLLPETQDSFDHSGLS